MPLPSRFREADADRILIFGIQRGRLPRGLLVWNLLLVLAMELREIIRHCAAIERIIAEIYASFAERWPQPPLGGLWRELANEELVHGALLDNAARLPAAKREEPSVDAPRLKMIREQVERRLPKLETTLDQALHTALDLEELELDNIYRRLLALTTDDSRMSSTFRSALGQYSHHEERLLAAIEEHSKDPSLLHRAAELRKELIRRGTSTSGR